MQLGDLNMITTVERAEEFISLAADQDWPDDDYFALVEHRDRLASLQTTPDEPPAPPVQRQEPEKATPSPTIESLGQQIEEADQRIAAAESPEEKATALVDRRVAEIQLANVELAAEFNDLSDDDLAISHEDLRAEAEEARERLKTLPAGSARSAKAEREQKEVSARAQRADDEVRRRRDATQASQVREQWIAKQSNRVVQNLYDSALKRVETDPNVPDWQKERARDVRQKARENPFDPKYMDKVRGLVAEAVRAEDEIALRRFASEGRRFYDLRVHYDGTPDTIASRVRDKLTGTAGDDTDGSFVHQLANALLS
jgi:hypothetical protein